MSQPDFLYELFEDFMNDPANEDFSMDNGLVCRWLTGQAKISPKISAYYSKPNNQKKLAETIHQNLLPLMSDCNMAMQDIYTLFIQDDTISDAKKKNLASLYKPASSRLLFLAKLISFGMERQFIKRDTKNQKLIAGGALSPIVLDYIMDSEVPKPCRHFIGRDKELEELYTMLEENRHVFLCGIAGIGKSELTKAYAKKYDKEYTNILYITYSGDLKNDIVNMDFADDVDENETADARFSRHHRHLRKLRADSLLIIDNFNTVTAKDSILDVILKYHCRILFTTRSKFDTYASVNLEEIADTETLISLMGCFYSDAEKQRPVLKQIIQAVHRHTLAVELSARLLETGILKPLPLLNKLKTEKAALDVTDTIDITKDGRSRKETYYDHIHTLFSLYQLSNAETDVMRNLSLVPLTGIPGRLLANWLKLCDMNIINGLIEKGFVQTVDGRTVTLHPMVQEVAMDETRPSVQKCRTLLDSIHEICLLHGYDISYYRQLFQMVESVIERIENDDMPYYLRFLEDTFPYMDKYHDLQGMKLVLNELSALKKLCRVIQEYNSDKTMDYASVQEAMDGICLTIGDIQQATTHFKKAMAIYEVLFESEPDVIEAKKQELLETYTQSGVYLGKKLLSK